MLLSDGYAEEPGGCGARPQGRTEEGGERVFGHVP